MLGLERGGGRGVVQQALIPTRFGGVGHGGGSHLASCSLAKTCTCRTAPRIMIICSGSTTGAGGGGVAAAATGAAGRAAARRTGARGSSGAGTPYRSYNLCPRVATAVWSVELRSTSWMWPSLLARVSASASAGVTSKVTTGVVIG